MAHNFLGSLAASVMPLLVVLPDNVDPHSGEEVRHLLCEVVNISGPLGQENIFTENIFTIIIKTVDRHYNRIYSVKKIGTQWLKRYSARLHVNSEHIQMWNNFAISLELFHCQLHLSCFY